jgi:predicted DNA-binding transcriptional regulator AlpA
MSMRGADEVTFDQKAYSVEQFCRQHDISRAFFYLMLARNTGPRTMKVGRRTLISESAAQEWREGLEQAQALKASRKSRVDPVQRSERAPVTSV